AMPKTTSMIIRKALRELDSIIRSIRKGRGASERGAGALRDWGIMGCQERLERRERGTWLAGCGPARGRSDASTRLLSVLLALSWFYPRSVRQSLGALKCPKVYMRFDAPTLPRCTRSTRSGPT